MRSPCIVIVLLLVAFRADAQAPCPGDTNGDRVVTIAELVQAVGAALDGCDRPTATRTLQRPTATRTAAPPTATPTATRTPKGGAAPTPTDFIPPTPVFPTVPAQTPTPVPLRGCPLRFTDSNTGDDDSSCWFNVTNPGNCGPDRFYSNGTQVIYVNDFVGDTGFYTGYFAATVASPTQATVTGRMDQTRPERLPDRLRFHQPES